MTLVGLSHDARVEIRWGLADIVPFFHIHPRTDICFGAITVFKDHNFVEHKVIHASCHVVSIGVFLPQ